jgi:hypothetical protein
MAEYIRLLIVIGIRRIVKIHWLLISGPKLIPRMDLLYYYRYPYTQRLIVVIINIISRITAAGIINTTKKRVRIIFLITELSRNVIKSGILTVNRVTRSLRLNIVNITTLKLLYTYQLIIGKSIVIR